MNVIVALFFYTERDQAESDATFETEEAVREPGGWSSQPGLQHGADQLHHSESQGHTDNCCSHEEWPQRHEERV